MRLLAVLAILIPASALAQSEPVIAPEPAAPPAPPAPAMPPPPPAMPPPPPAGYAAAPPGYARPVYMQPAPPPSFRHGGTFEANLGVGFAHTAANGSSQSSNAILAGLDLGVGGWVGAQAALTVRLSGVTDNTNGARASAIFLGPSLQYWVDHSFWLGGGLGLASVISSNNNSSDTTSGIGLDLRVGYSFSSTSAHTFNLSLELTPGFYSDPNGSGNSATVTGVSFLLGYQYL